MAMAELGILILLLSLSTNRNWLMIEAVAPGHYHDRYHTPTPTTLTVQLSSLFPPALNDTCKPSPRGRRKGASLEVRHKYGPCSPLNSNKNGRLSLEKILEHDKVRVESIRNRVNPKKVVDPYGVSSDKELNLPAKSGSSIGYPSFIVTLGLGTPKKDIILSFDTGSDLTWIQCEPCVKSCYKQEEAIFDPSKSSTYANISCNSPLCTEVGPATGYSPACLSSTCVYGIEYGDGSFSQGFFAEDTLYLGPQDSVPNFLFGCGENNQGLLSGISGLLGLAKDKLSVVSQTASQFGNYFSYCLPLSSSSTGHLTFGKASTVGGAMMQYIPLVGPSRAGSELASLYFIDLQGISVENEKLAISPNVFTAGGTVIDSGTIISMLPTVAYSALQNAFIQAMSKYNYPKAPASKDFDTCYDFSGYSNVTIPKISLHFGSGAQMELAPTGILVGTSPNRVCLAFQSNNQPKDVGILGTLQQTTFDIVYDVAGGKLGFTPGGCA